MVVAAGQHLQGSVIIVDIGECQPHDDSMRPSCLDGSGICVVEPPVRRVLVERHGRAVASLLGEKSATLEVKVGAEQGLHVVVDLRRHREVEYPAVGLEEPESGMGVESDASQPALDISVLGHQRCSGAGAEDGEASQEALLAELQNLRLCEPSSVRGDWQLRGAWDIAVYCHPCCRHAAQMPADTAEYADTTAAASTSGLHRAV
eukprot:COSAG05_NODE_2530_length_2940_cov_1.928220_3_plen_205_part_00